jgi:ComF family protein
MCLGPAIDGVTHPRCRTRYSLDGLTAFFHYRGVIRNAIKSIKYRFVSDLAKEFVNLIPSSFVIARTPMLHRGTQQSLLIPIPLHPSRLAFRGFNQAEVLGKILVQRLQIPLRTDILIRTKKTDPQVEMKDRKKRLENMKNVFDIHKSCNLNYESTVILFDDVCTTGATLRAAANVLKRTGVKRIWGVVMAHG